MTELKKYFACFVLCFLFVSFVKICPSFAQVGTDKPKEEGTKYVPEHERARLKDARKCVHDNPGNSWLECRHSCAELCNEILESYERGVCNGVIIQLCCGQHPTGCK